VYGHGQKFQLVGSYIIVVITYQGSSVGLCVQDYESVCAAVTICVTLVNTQTQTHTYSILTRLYDKFSQLN